MAPAAAAAPPAAAPKEYTEEEPESEDIDGLMAELDQITQSILTPKTGTPPGEKVEKPRRDPPRDPS